MTTYKVHCHCGLIEPIYTTLDDEEGFQIGKLPICDCGNYFKVTAVPNE